MHIAFILFRGEPKRGGAERYVDTLGHALIDRGHRVSVIASTFDDMRQLETIKLNAHGVTRTSRYRRFLDHVDRHLGSTRYDIVHSILPVRRCDVYHAQSGLEAVSLRESHLIKPTLARQFIAKWLAERNRKRRAFAEVEAELLNGPNPPITILLSDRERQLAQNLFPGHASRFVTVHNGVDDHRFTLDDVDERRKNVRRRLGIGEHQTVYLFIGQDFERKGLATAIRALAKLPDRNSILYVLGGGDINRYTQVATKAGVIGRVLFAGAVDDVPGFLAAADAFVFPTRYEPFGMVVVEAMLMGVPPVVSRVAGASEVVDDGRTGFVLDAPNDVQAWTHAMERVVNITTRAALREACLAERSRFSYDRHVEAIEGIYRRIAEGRQLTSREPDSR